jgi:hypothetical protein
VPTEAGGDLGDGYAGIDQAEDATSLVEVELVVGLGHPSVSVVQTIGKTPKSHFGLEFTRLHDKSA